MVSTYCLAVTLPINRDGFGREKQVVAETRTILTSFRLSVYTMGTYRNTTYATTVAIAGTTF